MKIVVLSTDNSVYIDDLEYYSRIDTTYSLFFTRPKYNLQLLTLNDNSQYNSSASNLYKYLASTDGVYDSFPIYGNVILSDGNSDMTSDKYYEICSILNERRLVSKEWKVGMILDNIKLLVPNVISYRRNQLIMSLYTDYKIEKVRHTIANLFIAMRLAVFDLLIEHLSGKQKEDTLIESFDSIKSMFNTLYSEISGMDMTHPITMFLTYMHILFQHASHNHSSEYSTVLNHIYLFQKLWI